MNNANSIAPGYTVLDSRTPSVSHVQERRRVGIFGGTFDPPHVAHVILAATAVHQLLLDSLVVTVAGVPWQKVGSRPITSAEKRLAMATAAFESVDAVEVSDMELKRAGNSYTVDTLTELSGDDVDLFLLLGSDTAAGLDTWERHEEVADLATIAVFPRRGYEDAEPPAGFSWERLELPGLEISSTDIRRRVSVGEPIDGLVTCDVQVMINEFNLYPASSESESAAGE